MLQFRKAGYYKSDLIRLHEGIQVCIEYLSATDQFTVAEQFGENDPVYKDLWSLYNYLQKLIDNAKG